MGFVTGGVQRHAAFCFAANVHFIENTIFTWSKNRYFEHSYSTTSKHNSMRYLYLLLFALTYAPLFAQGVQPELPRYMTAQEEALLWSQPPAPVLATGFTNPPSEPVRHMGEWEELQALIITWRSHPTILTEIVRAAREECRVIICCNTQSTVTSAQTTLTNAGVDISSNVEFVVVPNDSIWVRDYGPNCVYANDVDSLYLVDWIYNRPSRKKDDTLARTIAPYLNLPLFETVSSPTDLVNTGGNFMSDGMGTAFASELILEENEMGNPYNVSVKSEEQIDDILYDFMGIQRYIKMPTLPYDAIHHIDMHMKLLDEETLLVGQYPQGIADGPQIEANIQYVLSNYNSVFGTPYRVIRIPMPPDYSNAYPNTNGDYRTYSNAVFVNKTVIVPFYEQEFDTTAQRIWEESMPGYNVVGIDCNAIIPSLGAIHCITKEIGVNDPLHIVHQRLSDVEDNSVSNYPVFARIQHRSGVSNAKVWYTTDLAQPWQSVDMIPVDFQFDTSHVWLGGIPQQPGGATVYYYIEANSVSGKNGVRPLPAPEGWWKFKIKAASSIDEAPNSLLLDIYPNPARAITCIPVSAMSKTNGTIIVRNTLGQAVETVFEGQIPAGNSNYFLDAATYTPGTYFVELRAGDRVTVKKLIVR